MPKPKNWQDFESHTRVLFKCILSDPTTQQNGRSGQPQAGVDVYGYRNRDVKQLVGVQCKKKQEDNVSEKELREEVEKAKTFEPKLAEFILITTAPRDQKIQTEARIITKELAETTHSFPVSVWGWEDIEEHAAEHKEAWNAFDPTWNPFAESNSKKITELSSSVEEIKRMLILQRGEKTLPSIPSERTLNETDENTPRHGQITLLQKLIDDNKVAIALDELIQLKKNEWADASSSERYRILVGIASAKRKLGEYEETGNLLLDAYNECPQHKKARTNKAYGLLLTKRYKDAAALALKILKDDCSNTSAASILISSLTEDSTCHDPLTLLPEQLLSTEEVQIAHVHFLRNRNDSSWRDTANAALEKYPDSQFLKLFKAEAILDELVNSGSNIIVGGVQGNVTLQDKDWAVDILYAEAKQAVDNNLALPPQIANNAALALRFSGELSKAKELLDYAIQQNPSEEYLKLQRAIIAFSENEPKEVLSLLSECSTDPEAIVICAKVLEDEGQHSEALNIIEAIDEKRLPDSAVIELLNVRIHAYIGQGEKELAINIINQQLTEKPKSLFLKALQINTYRFIGDIERANTALEEALALVDEQTDLSPRFCLSFEAKQLGEYNIVVDLLKDHIDTNRESEGLHFLITSAINSNRLVIARELLDSIPESLHEKDWFLKADAFLSLNTGDTSADQKVARYLKIFPNDIQMILARLSIWQGLGRDNDIRRLLGRLDLDSLRGTPEQRIQLASIIIHYDDAERGLTYGYSILMNNWDKPKAHLAYQGLMLFNSDIIARAMLEATSVAENTAICLSSEGQERIYRIETNKYTFFQDERLTPTDDLALLLMGKKAGEKIELQERIGSKPTEIKWIKPIYLDACHRSMDQFNDRFPREYDLQKFTFDFSSSDPFEEMRAIVKARAEYDQKILDIYQTSTIPLAFIAEYTGKDPIDSCAGLSEFGIPFRTCRGNWLERNIAFQTIQQNKQGGCVLDAITLSLVRRLGIEQAVEAVCGPISTTQSIIDLFSLRNAEFNQVSGKQKGFLSWQENRLVLTEFSDEDIERAAADRAKEIEWARKIRTIPALPKKDFNHEIRKIIDMFGKDVCDPVIAADGNNLLLLSEDYGLRAWGATTFNISCVWLQPVLIIAKEKGLLPSDNYYEAVNKLALSGHNYIALEAGCLMYQARKDNFEITREVSTLLKMIGGPSADIFSNSTVLSIFLDAVIDKCTDDRKVKRIMGEAFKCFSSGRQEEPSSLIGLIYRKMKHNDLFVSEIFLGWLTGISIGMPYHKKLSESYNDLLERRTI
ncbi:PIN domain-containing protein [Candidatus Electrothrix sp.]|uniref:PIN domain-containing protein n=2 Tax=Candidatus Electrothrix sp. TaxID=2170559 RepID=UPI004057751C